MTVSIHLQKNNDKWTNYFFPQFPWSNSNWELSETLKKELQTLYKTLQPQKEQTEYLARKQAAELLGTREAWERIGNDQKKRHKK